ncbi:hypothetical protein [Tuwongella immobilis]|uniref:Uncharacterized protein n=1 Tax=Tuwongella immobilis TaxID=692036 RepID=A0A6C2YMD0_9BACT|nr:hypothetical protein [Tuwongella immobilis]VIP02235.1 unnamed protein product [Tuwongella immobilis]VTS00792.1 unnamed protein product [Tuwongella immobilis]
MTRTLAWLGLAVIVASLAPRMLSAESEPAESIETSRLEKLLVDHLRDAHNRGADLYNAGDPLSCYRIFEGVLLTTKAVLPHRPDVQEYINKSILDVVRTTSVAQRAFMLRETLVKVREMLQPKKPAVAKLPDNPRPAVPPMPPVPPVEPMPKTVQSVDPVPPVPPMPMMTPKPMVPVPPVKLPVPIPPVEPMPKPIVPPMPMPMSPTAPEILPVPKVIPELELLPAPRVAPEKFGL